MKKSRCTPVRSTLPIEFTYLIVLLLGLAGCSDDESPNPIIIDPQVQGLVDSFVEEAEKRQVDIDLTGLLVEFLDEISFPDGQTACGLAVETSPNAHIRMAQNCWDGFTEYEKEILMLHELGHALLFRAHDDREFENGSDMSMMNSDPYSIYGEYTQDRRDYYLDELFGTHDGTAPEWSMPKTNEKVVYESDFTEIGEWTIRSFVSETPEDYISFGLDSTSPVSDPSALFITSDNVNSETTHYWRLELNNPDIDPNSQLQLTAKIRGENLEGQGISISMRGDDSDGERSIFFIGESFEEQSDFGFVDVNLSIEPYTPIVDKVLVFFLIQSGTSGTAYLDDLKLVERF